nr:MAG TPA_asm: hypothetical protein [Caudoviricetes sp.]
MLAFGLIRYSYQTNEIYMYGRGERPFFCGGCFSSKKIMDVLECMELVHIIQCIGVIKRLLRI